MKQDRMNIICPVCSNIKVPYLSTLNLPAWICRVCNSTPTRSDACKIILNGMLVRDYNTDSPTPLLETKTYRQIWGAY